MLYATSISHSCSCCAIGLAGWSTVRLFHALKSIHIRLIDPARGEHFRISSRLRCRRLLFNIRKWENKKMFQLYCKLKHIFVFYRTYVISLYNTTFYRSCFLPTLRCVPPLYEYLSVVAEPSMLPPGRPLHENLVLI